MLIPEMSGKPLTVSLGLSMTQMLHEAVNAGFHGDLLESFPTSRR